MASIARSLHFLTQFMSSQSPQFFNTISWILSLKNNYFVLFIVFLNAFQFSICLDDLYFASLVWQSSFYYTLECLVILIHFENLYQIISDLFANSCTGRNRPATEPVMLKVCNVKLSFDIWLVLYIYFIPYSWYTLQVQARLYFWVVQCHFLWWLL